MGRVVSVDVVLRRKQAEDVYQKKSRLLLYKPERLEKLNRDYALLMQILDLYSQGLLKKDIAATVGVRQQKISAWLCRDFPISFRLSCSKRKKIDVKKIKKSPCFFYLLGAYQPRVKAINPKYLSIKSKDSWLEEKIYDCLVNLFGETVQSKRNFYESRSLMEYIVEETDDNRNLPRSMQGIARRENAYLNGLFDSRACVSSYNYKTSGCFVERKKPIIFIHVTNEDLISKIKELLLKHGICSSYVTDKRDGKRCLSINEFDSLKNCLRYFSKDSPKKEKLSELIHYVQYSKMRAKVLREKMLKPQPNTFNKKFYKKEYKVYY
ncbi:MAG: LAGLIDADG family homing endonuclease [Candidatus Woesearchaeota archaeon]